MSSLPATSWVTAEVIIQSTNAATWEWNIQTGAVVFNERWAEIIGYSLAELAPISIETWKRLVHPDDYKRSNDEFMKVFQHKKKFYSVEVRMKHRNGRWVWVLDSGMVTKWDLTGKPLIAVGTHVDITRTKRLQMRAEKNELKLRTIIENTKDIIYRISPNGIITYLSQAWSKHLGWSVQETIGKSFRPYVHAEDLEKLDVFFDKVAKSKTHQEIQGYRLQTQTGEWRYFETSASPIVTQRKITGFAGIARDITQTMQIQEALYREKEHFRTTLLSVGDGVIVTDTKGIITEINHVASKLLQLNLENSVGKALNDVFHVVHRETHLPHEDIVSAVLRQGERLEVRNVAIHVANDQWIPIDDSAAPIFDHQGEIQGVVIVFRNISEDLELQKRIEYLSYHDQQTDFYNRHYLKLIEPSLKIPSHLPLCSMAIDINDLKLINDTYGHPKGDDILCKAAAIIRRNVPNTDFIFRMGGDEFLVFLPQTTMKQAHKIHQAILDDIEQSCDIDCPLGLAIGYSVLTDMEDDLYEGIRVADFRMYEDKRKQK